jgi:exodeoxyribonuclease VII large subunit
MEKRVTLFELNRWIGDALKSAVPGTVWVMAEIVEMKENRNGHCYLDLAEKKGEDIIARARATIWSYTYRIIKPYFESITGRKFSPGLKILLNVAVEFHSVYGLSLNVKDIDPAFTMGEMALERKKIIDRLHREGVFNMNKELALPPVPQKIAVISSKTAAGYQDFMNQLENNPAGIKFYTHLFEAYMQGNEAVSSIISALEHIFEFEGFFDAVAIIRGGGATADLSCFDNYQLAFHITQFPLPVITGIGHEKDDTIADLVAHTRLKTPTAVAEFFISGAERFLEKLTAVEEYIVDLTKNTLDVKQRQLEKFAGNLQQSVNQFIQKRNNQLIKKSNSLQHDVSRFSFRKKYELNDLKHNLHSALSVYRLEKMNRIMQQKTWLRRMISDKTGKKRKELPGLEARLIHGSRKLIRRAEERIRMNESKVRLLNPENILKRGYTLTLKDGIIVKSTLPLQIHDEIETRFADGILKSKITKKE